MNRPFSPARAYFQRALAAQRQASTPAARADANAYELMLAKLTEDKRRLHDVQSFDRRAEIKRELLPEYTPWIEGVLKGDQGVQDDVLMTIMVWHIDVGNLFYALEIAGYAIKHKLAMPDQYKRSTGCLIAEEFADYALRQKDGIGADVTEDLIAAGNLVAAEDMPDEVRAKLLKAIGYGLDQQGDKTEAVDYLKRALALHDKVGVKKDIERLEREIKNSAAGNPGG
ncbi:MAG: phage terminase small subunit [Sterolibacterium sp.]|nr:phage terminase small subunit [Sterolibacterium sp.]